MSYLAFFLVLMSKASDDAQQTTAQLGADQTKLHSFAPWSI